MLNMQPMKITHHNLVILYFCRTKKIIVNLCFVHRRKQNLYIVQSKTSNIVCPRKFSNVFCWCIWHSLHQIWFIKHYEQESSSSNVCRRLIPFWWANTKANMTTEKCLMIYLKFVKYLCRYMGIDYIIYLESEHNIARA